MLKIEYDGSCPVCKGQDIDLLQNQLNINHYECKSCGAKFSTETIEYFQDVQYVSPSKVLQS